MVLRRKEAQRAGTCLKIHSCESIRVITHSDAQPLTMISPFVKCLTRTPRQSEIAPTGNHPLLQVSTSQEKLVNFPFCSWNKENNGFDFHCLKEKDENLNKFLKPDLLP